MENVIIYGIIGCIFLWPIMVIIGWVFKIIGAIIEFFINIKPRREQKERQARSAAYDAEVKRVCGNDWIAQMNYRVKKSLYEMREIRNKTHPEEFYRDENGLLQEIKEEKKEKKIELKIQDFKCPNCGAPLDSITEKMTATCRYCNITVAFVKN